MVQQLPSDFIIGGDFNLHFDDKQEKSSFCDILESYDLLQHIDFPTHKFGRTLDLFITSKQFEYIKSAKPSEAFCDHFSFIVELDIESPPKAPLKQISYRSISKIDVEKFNQDLINSELITNPKTNSIDLYDQYHKTLSSLLDLHAPIKKINCSERPLHPWMTPEVREAKQNKRRLERKWRKCKDAWSRRKFSEAVHYCNRVMSRAKNLWYTDLIDQNKNNPKKLWKSINQVLHRKKTTALPDFTSLHKLANSLGNFFKDKISRIMSTFTLNSNFCEVNPSISPPSFSSFVPVSEKEVKCIILDSPNKQCDLDACPTILVRSCVDVLVKPITSIINYSLSEGCFPKLFKSAIVTPLLKNPLFQEMN